MNNGVISDIVIGGDFFGVRDAAELADKLRGTQYSRNAVGEKFNEISLGEYINGADSEKLTDLLCEIDTIS